MLFPFMFRKLLFIQIFQEVHVIIVVLITCVTSKDRYDPASTTNAWPAYAVHTLFSRGRKDSQT
jgi:hypothetical protein